MVATFRVSRSETPLLPSKTPGCAVPASNDANVGEKIPTESQIVLVVTDVSPFSDTCVEGVDVGYELRVIWPGFKLPPSIFEL
jgi:hypothetical protein